MASSSDETVDEIHLADTEQLLPVAIGADGRPLASIVGDPPDIDGQDPAADLLQRAELATETASPPGKAGPGQPDPALPEIDDATLLVNFEEGTTDDTVDAALNQADLSGQRINGTDTVVVDTDGTDPAAMTVTLESADGVASVEANLVRHTDRVPNDAELTSQSSYLQTIGLPAAWELANTTADVTVAVLDTGVDLDHPDLAPNLVPGYDFINNDSNPQDDNGHGTQVAGIVGAATDNNLGIAGVAWNAKVMPIKVLDATGRGTDAQISTGIRWSVDHGADIVNLSLGAPGTTLVLNQAIDYAIDHDVVVVAAAGNGAAQVPNYPAASSGVIGVTATDHTGQFAWFSNHGPWVTLAAPGTDIHTTALASGTTPATTEATGTSFSAPIVAGVAALLLERHPSWTWDTVAWQLLRTAADRGPAGIDNAYGFGLLNAAAAIGVSPVTPLSQPNLSSDAANLPNSARRISTTGPTTETLAYEYDEDWFSFDLANPAGATITVTPPPALADGVRAGEMDPVVEVYGPGGGLVAVADTTFTGEPEQLHVNLDVGQIRIRVRNYFGSTAPAPYSVLVELGDLTPEATWAPTEFPFSVDSFEWAVAVADVNGDSRDDVVMSTGFYFDEVNDFKLFVFTQQADGSLSEPVRLATHIRHQDGGLVAGDFDGDGDSDIAIGTWAGVDVAWQGEDGLAEPVLYPVEGGAVTWLSAADMDGTGPSEIVLTGPTLETMQSLHWNGSSFTSTALPFITRVPFAVGDVNGDDRTDIATVERDDVNVQMDVIGLHLQQPDGSWAPTATTDLQLPTTHDGVQGITIGDISGDGRKDLALSTDELGQPHVLTLLQQPNGLLGSPVSFPTVEDGKSIRIADVTDDDRPDVIAMHDQSRIQVFRQTSTGTLDPDPQPLSGGYASHVAPDALAIGDLDSDGVNDIAAATYGSGLAVIKHRRTVAESIGPLLSGTTPLPHATNVAPNINPTLTFGRDIGSVHGGTVFIADGLTGQRLPGQAVDWSGGRSVTIAIPQPRLPGHPYQVVIAGITDQFGSHAAFASFPFVTAVAGPPSYNVNGSYWPFRVDLVGDGYDDVLWYTPSTASDPIWFFGPAGKTETSTQVQGTFVPTAGDFDGNGFEDVYWYSPGAGTDIMWFNGPDGIVQKTITVNGTYVPVVGDFDRNGFDDIFWYGPGAAGEALWSFRSGGAYTSTPMPKVNGTGYRLTAGDFNRDGFDDVFWHMPGTGGEALWKGRAGGFTSTPATAVNGTYNLRSGDFNADGHDDIYWYAGSAASLWRGNPTGFTSQPAPAIAPTARPVTGDFTGDGHDDLLAYVPGTTPDRLLPGTPTGL